MICPKCGSMLDFNFIYSGGIPSIVYTCMSCDYDSRNVRTTVSNRTCMTEGDISVSTNTKRLDNNR